ncbi:MAG: creatininase family protein [Anaerolineae bacterium]|nr:creatininase family protein [Anaerolineae bacterium]
MPAYALETLFPDELAARLAARPLLVLPLGTVEWHSQHLPLGFDGLVAARVGERIAAATAAVLAPVTYWAAGGVPYPYTFRLPVSVIEPLLQAVLLQCAGMGFRVICAYTGHFGIEQTLALKRAALHAMETAPVTVLPLTAYDLVTDMYTGDHAAAGETAMMQALHPELVRLHAITPGAPLDGILGPDPRTHPVDGAALVNAIVERAAAVALRLLEATTPVARARYIEAQGLAVRVLAKTFEQRGQLPKAQVPAITTPAYVAACQALYAGDYDRARGHLERKLGDLSA